MSSRVKPIVEAKRRAFLEALAVHGVVTHAARDAGLDRVEAYRLRETDPGFAAQWDDAIQQAADALEREARRRAVEGVEEPVFYQGVEVGTVRKYSDSLLTTMLKAKRAEYRDASKLELSGRLAIGELTEEEIRKELAALSATHGIAVPAALPPDADDLDGLV
ncbi:MAG: hypothetical protein ACK5XA_07910 [Tagaea sp.]